MMPVRIIRMALNVAVISVIRSPLFIGCPRLYVSKNNPANASNAAGSVFRLMRYENLDPELLILVLGGVYT